MFGAGCEGGGSLIHSKIVWKDHQDVTYTSRVHVSESSFASRLACALRVMLFMTASNEIKVAMVCAQDVNLAAGDSAVKIAVGGNVKPNYDFAREAFEVVCDEVLEEDDVIEVVDYQKPGFEEWEEDRKEITQDITVLHYREECFTVRSEWPNNGEHCVGVCGAAGPSPDPEPWQHSSLARTALEDRYSDMEEALEGVIGKRLRAWEDSLEV